MGVRVLATLAMTMAAACGSPTKSVSEAVAPDLSAPSQLIAGNSMYVPGEYLLFKVKWKGFAGGSTQMIVGQPGVESGRNAIVVRSITTTEGIVAVFKHLRDELTTFVDVDSGAPIRSQNNIESGREQRSIEVEFGDRGFEVSHNPPRQPRESWSQAIPEDGPWAHDIHSILAHLRAWNPSVGTRGYAYIQSARSFFRLELVAASRDEVETPSGVYAAIRYEGLATALGRDGKPLASGLTRKMRFWIGTDDDRLPVKLQSETELGDVIAVLAEHRRSEGAVIRSGDSAGAGRQAPMTSDNSGYAAASRAIRTASR